MENFKAEKITDAEIQELQDRLERQIRFEAWYSGTLFILAIVSLCVFLCKTWCS